MSNPATIDESRLVQHGLALSEDQRMVRDMARADAQAELRRGFGIEHTTIQLENVGCGQVC